MIYYGALKQSFEKGIANHCRIVSISVNEDLLLCSLRCISATLDSFVAHRMRFIVSISAACFEVPKTSSSSEKVVTHSANVTRTCSTRMSEARDFVGDAEPRRYVCRWPRTVLKPLTSASTVCASFGAALVFLTKVVSTDDTVAAAPRIPMIDADTDNGSMTVTY